MNSQFPIPNSQRMSNVNARTTARGRVDVGHLALKIIWKLDIGNWIFRRGTRAIVGYTVVLVMAMVVLPGTVLAAANPQVDPSCWTAKECTGGGANGSYNVTSNTGGSIETHWEEDVSNCGPDWGRCFPGKKIPLTVHVPTRGGALTEVSNIGQYVGAFYTWGVRIAAILAVIMIMVGGVLWMTSGAAGTAQKAKDFIKNAVIGLLLALGSYLMLQTINPDLVKLTPPRLYMIRPVTLVSRCNQLAGVSKTGPYQPEFAAKSGGPYDLALDQLACTGGPYYHASLTGTCFGHICNDPKQVCAAKDSKSMECIDAQIGGSVHWQDRAFIEKIRLVPVCENGVNRNWEQYGNIADKEGETEALFADEANAGVQQYAFPASGFDYLRDPAHAQRTLCGAATLRGFMFQIEVNDPGVTGFDDDFYVGRSGDRPLTVIDEDGDRVTSPRSFSTPAAAQSIGAAELMTADEINAGGLTVDINIRRDAFD